MQIKMFYIGAKIGQDEAEVNAFLQGKGKAITGVQMVSSALEGGDTLDTIMVIFDEGR